MNVRRPVDVLARPRQERHGAGVRDGVPRRRRAPQPDNGPGGRTDHHGNRVVDGRPVRAVARRIRRVPSNCRGDRDYARNLHRSWNASARADLPRSRIGAHVGRGEHRDESCGGLHLGRGDRFDRRGHSPRGHRRPRLVSGQALRGTRDPAPARRLGRGGHVPRWPRPAGIGARRHCRGSRALPAVARCVRGGRRSRRGGEDSLRDGLDAISPTATLRVRGRPSSSRCRRTPTWRASAELAFR